MLFFKTQIQVEYTIQVGNGVVGPNTEPHHDSLPHSTSGFSFGSSTLNHQNHQENVKSKPLKNILQKLIILNFV
jgi:hypothetical protein